MKRALGAALAVLAIGFAHAQSGEAPNAVLLVAKPGLQDPNFRRSVVLVTQAPDGHTLGVILNRPTRILHEGHRLRFGGPVMNRVIVALFRSDEPPAASAFPVLKGIYLSMHPENVDRLVAAPPEGSPGRMRLYSGFAAWSPGQLQGELQRDSWYLLPADEAIAFREDTDGMWEELVARAGGPRT